MTDDLDDFFIYFPVVLEHGDESKVVRVIRYPLAMRKMLVCWARRGVSS